MATKKTTKSTKPATARGATPNSTGVYRLPTTVKLAVEAEALTDGATPAAIVRVAIARELERRGYKLEAATRLACGI